jgi:hypothetical protein
MGRSGGGGGVAVEREQKGVGGRGLYGEEKGMRGGEGSGGGGGVAVEREQKGVGGRGRYGE